MSSSTSTIPTIKSTYRSLLRELPRRNNTRLLSHPPTPLHMRLREIFRSSHQPQNQTHTPSQTSRSQTDPETESAILEARIQEAHQMASYAKAQRTYAALLERYNPGINLEEQERIRLTARRVGLDLPVQAGEEGGRKE